LHQQEQSGVTDNFFVRDTIAERTDGIHQLTTSSKKYRVLMFSPAFAPFANPEAIVNSKLALALTTAGWEVNVVSRNLSETSSYNYGSGWNEPWTSLREIVYTPTYRTDKLSFRLVGSALGAYRMGYPIEGCRWALSAYECAKDLHRSKGFDAILSRSLPAYAHLPAMRLAADTGIPWIANWNDPLLLDALGQETRLSRTHGPVFARFCKSVVNRSSWMTFPSDELRRSACLYLGDGASSKSSSIPHAALPFSGKKNWPEDKFRVFYAGRLWSDQDPTLFLKALKNVIEIYQARHKITFVFAGIDDIGLTSLAASFGLQDNVAVLGRMHYSEVQAECERSSALLGIDPIVDNGIRLMSKYVDYSQSGRPILAIAPKEGVITRLISKHGGGIAAGPQAEEEITRALATLFQSWADGSLDLTFNSEPLWRLFSPDAVIEAYGALIDNLRGRWHA
jgi:glycosyltransferase involved in cell wall biosynthesis